MKYSRCLVITLGLCIHALGFAQIEKPKPAPKPSTSTTSKPNIPVTTKSPIVSTEGWVPFVFQSKWGYKDKTGTVVLQPALDYDYCYPFRNGVARVCNNGNYYFIDAKGDKIIDKGFDNALDFSEGLAPVQDVNQKTWHYINKKGEIAIYEEYDGAYEFVDGCAIVLQNKKKSFIDTKGVNIFHREFDGAQQFKNGIALVYESSPKWTLWLIDKTGRNIFGDKVFSNGTSFYIGGYSQVADIANPNGYYLIDKKGTRKELPSSFVIQDRVNFANQAEVTTYGKYFIGRDSISKKYCFLNENFEPMNERYKGIYMLGEKGNFRCLLESGKWVILDKDLRQVGQEYLSVGMTFDNALTSVRCIDSLYRFVDEKGVILKEISSMNWPGYGNGVWLIKQAPETFWYINVLGKKKFGPYRWAYSFEGNPLAPVQAADCYFIKGDGSPVNSARYEDISFYRNGLAMVSNGGKKWYVNYQGENVFNKTFEAANDFNWHGFATAKQNGKWGCINTDGKIVIPFFYDACNPFRNHELTEVNLNGKWGFINKKGELVIPCIYEDEDWFGWNGRKYSRVKYNGKWGCIDDTGKVLVKYIYATKEDVPVPE